MMGSKRPRLSLLLLAGFLLAGAALRLIRLDFQPLWWDEGYSVWFAGQGLAEMMRLTAVDIHPPLYYALLHGWQLLFGLHPISLRLFSILVSLPAIPLAWALGRDLGDRKAGLWAALFVTLSPFAIFYSQEIRMYGLATTFSLAAMWTGWRWAQEKSDWKWGVAYALSVVAGMYILYMFALLPAAQFVWVILTKRRRVRTFLMTLVIAGLAYLPWALYAGPKLLSYISYKVGKDNDSPLPFFTYLGRHLSAFMVGHLEGSLASFWPVALLLLLPPLLALTSLLTRKKVSAPADRKLFSSVSYLATILLFALLLGFVQQMRAPFIPDRFERVLLFAAPALWLLIALGLRMLWRISHSAGALMAALFTVAFGFSLFYFYTTPRYPQGDYRPLVATIQREMRPGDSIFAVFPWQVGYFWAYLPPEQHHRVHLSPDPDWSDDVQRTLDEMLSQGGVWLPEHLALGGIFELKAEKYLDQNSWQIRNSWFGEETRLTAWDIPRGAPSYPLTTPQDWGNGIILDEAMVQQGPYRLFFTLVWRGSTPSPALFSYTLALKAPDGYRWGQRDVAPFAQPWPDFDAAIPIPWRNSDRVALTLPAGAPPGEYDLGLTLMDSNLDAVGQEASLGVVTLGPPDAETPPWPEVAVQQADDDIDFLGCDLTTSEHLPGDELLVTLYWHPHHPLNPAHQVFLQLLDEKGHLAAGYEAPPVPWLPTTSWNFDAPLRTQHRMILPADLSPSRYTLIAGLFEPESKVRVRFGRQDWLKLGKVVIAPRGHAYQAPRPQQPLNLLLQGGHRLLGYDLEGGMRPGAPMTVTLYWQPAGALNARYRVFVHLLGADDAILTQDDVEPDHGRHPTTSWLPGEYITDSHILTLPTDGGAVDNYRLEIGLYEPKSGRRLPFVEEDGAIRSDHIILPLH